MDRRIFPQRSSSHEALKPVAQTLMFVGREAREIIEDIEVPSDLCMYIIADRILRLGKEVARLDVTLGLRLEHTGSHRLEVEVLAVSGLDQPIEHRVLEDGPPGAIVRVPLDEARILPVNPPRGNLSRRLMEVRADLEAVVHPLLQ